MLAMWFATVFVLSERPLAISWLLLPLASCWKIWSSRWVSAARIATDETGVYKHAAMEARVPGPDPAGNSYSTYASFSDPDGNTFVLQEIKARLPGREWT